MRVFISHSATDDSFAKAVGDALIGYGFAVWSPDRELLPGDNWLLEAGRALERADAVIFLLSATSVASPFARLEIQYVIAQAKFAHRVFPVLVGKRVPKIPWVLKDLVIDAPAADAERTAYEIATRLRPLKSLAPPSNSKRRVRASVPRGTTKQGKSTKRTSKRRRRRATPIG
jgi:TIR domain